MGTKGYALVAMLALSAIFMTTAQADGLVSLTVTPDEIEQGTPFEITVTGPRNASVELTIAALSGDTFTVENRTDAEGVWTYEVGLFLAFGPYRATALIRDETAVILGAAEVSFRVICAGSCVNEVLAKRLGSYETQFRAGIDRLVLIVVVLVLALEVPRLSMAFYKSAETARKEGKLTPREYVQALTYGVTGFIPPSRQGIRMAANERIATDLARREAIDELHRATGERFREYDPVHARRITELVSAVRTADERVRSLATRMPRR